MKADYQLKHQLFGRQGSMWERQVNTETRTRIRSIVKTAGQSTVLSQLDLVAGGALNHGSVLSEDAFFRFEDGNFAVVGQHQRDYHHHTAQLSNGLRLHVAYRRGTAVSSTDPLPTKIARIAADFINAINKDAGTLPSDRDWYLIPIPRNLCPIVIEGRNDEYLVQGIDFLARDGYIALSDSPGDVLPYGMVRVPVAQHGVSPPNSFVLSAPSDFRGGRYLSEYAYKSQSIATFRRAAAEYAGLYVFQAPDVVISSHRAGSQSWIYTMANAGAVLINYDHVELEVGQTIDPGFVICNRFEVVSSLYNNATNRKKIAADGWGSLSLDGILPVNGLTWEAGAKVELDSVVDDPTSGKPHLRPQFGGDPAVLERFWEFSRLHEQQTQVFLYDYLGEPSLPTSVDFWDLLENFYGIQLTLVLSDAHTDSIDSRLRKFLIEFHPASCSLLLGLKTNLPPGGAAVDDYGNPLLDEYGDYIPAGDMTADDPCQVMYLSYGGAILSYGGKLPTYTVCAEGLPPGALYDEFSVSYWYDDDVLILVS